MLHWHGALCGLAFEASLEKLCQRSLPALRSISYKCFRCYHLFIHLGLDAAWYRTKSFFAPQLSAARDVPEYWIACPCSHRHRADLQSLHCTISSSPLLSSTLLSGTNDQILQFAQPLVLTFLFSPDVVKILRKCPTTPLRLFTPTNLSVGCDQSLRNQTAVLARWVHQKAARGITPTTTPTLFLTLCIAVRFPPCLSDFDHF
jgi:hypothetical protein